eukprot:6471878-Amphidinium_carterae.1
MYGSTSWVVMWSEEALAKKRAAAEAMAQPEGCIDSDEEVDGGRDEDEGGVGKETIGEEEEEEAEEEQDVEEDLDEHEEEEEEMDKEQKEALARLEQREAFANALALRDAEVTFQCLARLITCSNGQDFTHRTALAHRAAEVHVINC